MPSHSGTKDGTLRASCFEDTPFEPPIGNLARPLLHPTAGSQESLAGMSEGVSEVHWETPSFAARVYVFVLFTQAVQMLMSYDGGATQFCTDSLADAGWSPFWLGLLGAMDKFGQVATAFIWGEMLMRLDAKKLLVVGLFWKAACCYIFGRLQQQSVTVPMQLCMLLAKMGMGVTEALVSVWATVWVQRNAPANARAQWLSLAGTSAGIGSGIGSGVASLWDPIYAFFLQATVLLGVWVAMVLTPAGLLRLDRRASGEPTTAGEAAPSYSPPQKATHTSLAQEVARALDEVRVDTVALESMRLPGHFLDASTHPDREGWKVRMTRGDPSDIWALFKLSEARGHVITMESVRLPGHFLVAASSSSSTPGCASPFGECLSRHPVTHSLRLREGDGSDTSAQFTVHPLVGRSIHAGAVTLESSRFPRCYMDATETRLLTSPGRSTKVCLTQGDLHDGNWAHFVIRRQPSLLCNADATPLAEGVAGRLRLVLRNSLWLWTAMAISLSCFVMSGVAFLWQNTVRHLWGYSKAVSFAYFIFCTGAGGLLGVILGGPFFDIRLGGFADENGTAKCLHSCRRMTLIASMCASVGILLLLYRAYRNIEDNAVATLGWHFYVLAATVFMIFFFVNAMMGTFYGINTDANTAQVRTFAAGLTVSFQNIFGYAFGPLLPSAVAEAVGNGVIGYWPDVQFQAGAIAGARYAAGMAVALAMVWVLFLAVSFAEVSARVLKIRAKPPVSPAARS